MSDQRFNTGNPIGSDSPLDRSDNTRNLDVAVNSEADTFQDRLGQSRLTWAGVVNAGSGDPAVIVPIVQQAVQDVVDGVDGQVDVAQSAADRAETARDAAFVNADVYPDIASGLAAVADGEQFQVALGNLVYERYRKDGSTAVLVGDFLSGQAGMEVYSSAVRGNPGKNLFDPRGAIDGRSLSTTTGELIASTTRSVSDWIVVEAGVDYYNNVGGRVFFYTATKAFIESQAGYAGLTAPSGAAYARVNVITVDKFDLQLRKAGTDPLFEPFTNIADANSVAHESLKVGSVRSSNIAGFSVSPLQMADAVLLNMHDGSLRNGIRYTDTDGYTEIVTSAGDVTSWIPVRPGTQYAANELSRVFFYDADRNYIGFSPDRSFVTPDNAHWVRFNLSAVVSFRFQFNEGEAPTAPFPQPHKYRLRNLVTDGSPDPGPDPDPVGQLSRKQNADTYGRFLNLSDAWYAWRNGEKFPIAFLGDSTTHGNGVYPSGARPLPADEYWGVDYIRPGAYPGVLESLVHAATGTDTARCYNFGYSGRNASWGAENFPSMLVGDYEDTKMVGISYGINDRGIGITDKQMADNFRDNVETIIVQCYDRGIQPFLLTTQPIIEPGDDVPTINIHTSERASSVANRVKKELADKWGLELIDINALGSEFQSYSQYPLLSPEWPPTGIYESVNNSIHWATIGHRFEAEAIFAHICPRVIWTTQGERLDFSTQQVVSDIDRANITQIIPFVDGFKVKSEYTKVDSSDIRMQEFWLFNMHRGLLELTAFAGDSTESAYVKVDDVTTQMTSAQQSLGSLDMGLHRIEAWSGATTAVNFRGFKVEPLPN